MADIPIQMTPAEQQAHREERLSLLIRVAEKCGFCDGDGYWTNGEGS